MSMKSLNSALQESAEGILRLMENKKVDSEMVHIKIEIKGEFAVKLRLLRRISKNFPEKAQGELYQHIMEAGIDKMHEIFLKMIREKIEE